MTDRERLDVLTRALEIIALDAAPDDWKPYDGYGDYSGYDGEWTDATGKERTVDGVDISNSGDVHDHGAAMGAWYAAKTARKALKESAE